MKKKLTRTNNQPSLRLLAVILTLLIAHYSLLIVSCEQPFKAGLGPVIDLQAPTIVLETPIVGTYIRGETEFTGRAADDYKLDTVWFHLSNFPEVALSDYKKTNVVVQDRDENGEVKTSELIFHKITDTTGDSRNISWKFRIDTMLKKNGERVFPDGDLKIRLRVTDSVGKEYITDEYVFSIKNDIPEIVIDAPPIVQGMQDGDLGSEHFNYNYLNDNARAFKRVMETEGMLVGRISDFEGLNKEDGIAQVVDKHGAPVFNAQGIPETKPLYPPQIRFWHVDYNGSASGYSDAFEAGVVPTPEQVPWVRIGPGGVGQFIGGDGVKNRIFTYTLPDKSGQYYAFQVRAQSIDREHSEAEYPKSYYNDFDNQSAAFKAENAYVLIRVIEPLEYPALSLYQLEDIYGAPSGGKPSRGAPADGAVNGAMQYNRLPEITDQMEKDGNHVYVDKPIVTKGGAFTLRMKASHSQDLSSVKVYWEKDDKSEKGRFIWDWIDKPHSEWAASMPIPSRSSPYYTWGLNEWDGVGSPTTYNSMVRSFVFTYNDDGNDKVPDTADYYADIRGRSKVQRYIGPDDTQDDKGVTKKYSLDELPEDKAGWFDVPRLDEGTYNLSVYATSMGGTRIANPFVITITIDRTKPEIELTDIIGRAGEIDEELNEPTLVNGVIQPKFTISDSRVGSSPYFINDSAADAYYPERMFILVKETDTVNKTVKKAVDEHFKIGSSYDNKKNIWPEFNTSNIPVDIPGVPIVKHGLIISSACRFKTSPIYHIPTVPTETDTLEDGVYWVYAFVRDTAFNVGSLAFPIDVKASSDWPTFDWEGNSIYTSVTQPDSSYDVGGANYNASDPDKKDKSFITSDGVRNKLEPGASILVSIADDDSLNLGEGAGVASTDPKASGIKVTFIGSKPDASGTIAVRPLSEEIVLSDAEVKAAFTPQTVNTNGERIAAKSSKGTINQTVLLNGIKAKNSYNDLFGLPTNSLSPTEQAVKDSFNSLPDGIYRVGITISDYQPAKLHMDILTPYAKAPNVDPKPADIVTVNINNKVILPSVNNPSSYDLAHYTPEYFWIAVDSKNPVIDINYTTTRPSGLPISITEPSPLEGSVSDENGPITMVKWEVRNLATGKVVSSDTNTVANWPKIITTPLDFKGYDAATGKWKYDFKYQMSMNDRTEGAFNFEITYKDRFNNETTQTLTYMVDTTPPKVSLIKPIETFSRPFDDVDLHTNNLVDYPQDANASALNKERLAVKVVNFSMNVVDDNVKGVRWWLLPWNVGADENGRVTSGPGIGIVNDYDAFPSNIYKDDTPGASGTYYLASGSGAYGFVNKGGQITVAIDTTKLEKPNGQYRLHIIAIDDANNVSVVGSVSVTPPIISGTRVFQEVFFLQEEDRPYFGENKNETDTSGNTKNNITPGYAITGAQWPKTTNSLGQTVDVDMEVRRGNLLIRGTIQENNGFLAKTPAPAAPYDTFWEGSLTIWFSDSDADAYKNLPDNWEALVAAGSDIRASTTNPTWPNYTKKQIPSSEYASGVGKSGRNISLAIELSKLFSTAFDKDGKKRYIIKATDSPVNKLWYNGAIPTKPHVSGTPMGAGNTNGEDEGVRVSRWKQFAFIYDAKPPVVVITKPNELGTGNKFGTNFADATTGFNLVGSMSDMNLDKDADGKYYFKYYVDSNATAVRTFVLDNSEYVMYEESVVDDTPTVTFNIKPTTVQQQIITQSEFAALTEGQHTLNVFAYDKSGQEGAAWVSFTKDMKPPTITFTNLAGDSRPYDSTNASKVDKASAGAVTGWWNKTNRQSILLTNNNFNNTAASPAKPLSESLTTIYYDNGIPELRGNITDLVSNIKLDTPVANTAVSDTGVVNVPASSFRYWIDNELSSTTPAISAGRHLAIIDGAGTRSVRWTILLTSDGTKNGTILPDGVHTIVLTVADEAGQEIQPDDRYMIAFRIDSKQPTATVSVTANQTGVFGNADYQNATMFTLSLKADDANLKEMELRIVRKEETTDVETVKTNFTPIINTTGNTWTYTPGTPSTQTNNLATLDAVSFTGSYNVPKFTSAVQDGKYEAIVASYDTAGNKSEEFIFPFTYDKTQPSIVFTNPDKTNENPKPENNTSLKPEDFIDLGLLPAVADLDGKTKNNINRLTSENLRIQGNVIDAFSAISVVESRVEKWNWTNRTGATNVAGTWTQVEDWKPVRDLTGNKLLQISWTKNLLGQTTGDLDLSGRAPALAGTALTAEQLAAAEGLYRIKIRAKDSSVIAVGADAVKNGWTYPAGQGNPIVSDYVYFYFDRTNPELKITKINGNDAGLSLYYTNPPSTGFTFEGTVRDNNRFAKVEVTFETSTATITRTARMSALTATNPPDPDYSAQDSAPTSINVGGVKQNWIADGFTSGNTTLPDGRYKVTIVAYDMTGRSVREERSFILDSTKPRVVFTLPAKAPRTGANSYSGFGDDSENSRPTTTTPAVTANGFASLTVEGGPTSVITGTTEDKGNPLGTESGIDQMWFRLGFIDGVTYNTTNVFPTKTAIEDDEIALIIAFAAAANPAQTLTAAQVRALPAKDRNDWMNKIAEYRASSNTDARGNSWFKLGGGHKPTGFVIDNPNIYDWRFEIPSVIEKMPSNSVNPSADYDNYLDYVASGIGIGTGLNSQIGGLKLYCSEITVKGRKYYVNPTAAPIRQMVRAVDGQPGGVYRLPLWVRITDIAGNVEYYCHDIWIDANGDIPSTSIESPSNGTQYNARGGAISVDGVAKSNTSVYDVIFRVFADNVPDTNLEGRQDGGLPNNTNKTIGGANNLTARPNLASAANPAKLIRIDGYETAPATTVNALPNDAYYRDTAWQKANLTLPPGSGEPLIPWSVMIKSDDNWASLISTHGFKSNASLASNNRVRMWLEVFVFSGEGSAPTPPARTSIYPNDNLGVASYNNTANGGLLYGSARTAPPFTAADPGPRPYVKAFYLQTNAPAITHPNVGTWDAGNNTTPFTAPFRRGNFMWNGENAQNQGGGGYAGAGTEMRSNRFAFSATLDPKSSGLGEVAYRIKLDGGSYNTWVTAWKKGDTTYPTNPEGVNSNGIRISVRDGNATAGIRYYFDYAIASKSTINVTDSGTTLIPVPGANWVNTGGTITLQIRMRDGSTPPNEAEQTIQVSVDNFAPIGDPKSYGNATVAGTNVNFIGRAYDYATAPANEAMPKDSDYAPKKLKRVYAWFTKTTTAGTYYVNMNTGALGKAVGTTTTGTPVTAAMTAFSGRNPAIVGGGANDVTSITMSDTTRGTSGSIYVPQKVTTGTPAETSYNAAWVREIDQASGQPANKMLWSPVNSANYDVRWSFTLDSTKLPDGKITLHYVVEDEAGNRSYYTQPDITVKNRYPEITKVTLYTDNNGQGAAFTKDAMIEYDLNDYRSKMFANYTDATDKAKSDSTGYLNSGFISKNNYIGFKVETMKGNRPLTFRLQYVKRERLPLNSTNLQNWLRASNSDTNINLYTIAWHGDYSSANWKAIGVPAETNPTLGTHFILQWPEGSDLTGGTANGTLPANYKSSTTAEVWKYTYIAGATKPDVRPLPLTGNPTPPQAQDPAVDPVVLGPDDASTGGVNFRFLGTSDFTNIDEKDGSHPDAGDTKPDNPTATDEKGTAFFLIRVWDSVGGTATGEAAINERLHDALVVGMNVYKRDNIKPVARLYDLNPYTETAVVDGNPAQTIRNAAWPNAIGSNIVRGGLYNAGTTRDMVRSGFINPRGGSKFLDPKNGLYDNETATRQLINGLPLPDYPLKITTDSVPTTVGVDQVSGKIILRGLAWDDQLIDTITLTLDGNARTILQLNSAGKMAATAGYADTAFPVEELHWKTGHTVEWAYIWDTGTDPKTNVLISVQVKDKKGTTITPPTAPPATPGGLTSADLPADPNSPTQTNPTPADTDIRFHSRVRVDIVPYITGFERKKPQFTTKRSLQGWYSFYQGEGGADAANTIKVLGYNFGTSGATAITLNGANVVNVGAAASATERTFGIPDGATSGAITMTVNGGTPVYNNSVVIADIATKSWNREYNTYAPGSDLWINKPYAHIWQSREAAGNNNTAGTIIGVSATSEGMDSPAGRATPSMSLQYSGNNPGTIHAAWSKYNRDEVYYGTNTGGNSRLLRAGEPYTHTDIDFYNGPNINTDNRYNASVVVSYQRDGGPRLVLKATIQDRDVSGGDDNSWVVGAGTNGNMSTSSDRFKNPRIRKIAVSGTTTASVNTPTQNLDNNPGTVIISVFDSYDNRLLYSRQSGAFASGSNSNSFGTVANQAFLDGGGTVENGTTTTANLGSVPIVAASVNNSNVAGTIGRSSRAGQYSAIDYDSNGRPVIAYFDDQNQTLRLLYANSDAPNGGAAWTRRYVLPESHPLRLGSGSYISMKIQRAAEAGNGTAAQGDADQIHLAFYNSNNKAIVYAVGTRTGAFTASVVDRVVEGGQWTDIALDQSNNPWIVYADSTRTGNRDGVRIAYKSSGTGTTFTRPLTDAITGTTITGWEAMTMPADFQVNNDRLNIAAWPPKNSGTALGATSPIGGWNAAVGYSGSDKFRLGYFIKPGTAAMAGF